MKIEDLPILPTAESETVEFAAVPEIEPLARTAAAFLNGRGGIILVGFSDDAEMAGLPGAPEAVAEQLRDGLANAIKPSEWLQVTPLRYKGRTGLLVEVPEGSRKPYLTSGRVFTRKDAADVEAKPGDISRMIAHRASAEERWERRPFVGVTPEMLDPEVIHRAVQASHLAVPTERTVTLIENLERLDLAAEGWPTRAAAALFITEPAARRRMPQARAQFAAFKDDSLADLSHRASETGGALHLLETLFALLQSRLHSAARLPATGLQRTDRPEYPLGAVREALVNALMHREYDDAGGVRVSLFPDRIEVWNPGMLPAVYINDPDARLVSRPHNPDIARVFNYMGYAETMGIGMWRIRNEMAQAGLPSPTWANHGGGVLLTLPRTGQVRKSQIEASVLPARAVAFLRETNPGEQFTTVQYRDRFAPNVSERSARSDIRALVEQGFLRQEGRGYQTTYVRLPKSAGNG